MSWVCREKRLERKLKERGQFVQGPHVAESEVLHAVLQTERR